jgi:hypothetical protein
MAKAKTAKAAVKRNPDEVKLRIKTVSNGMASPSRMVQAIKNGKTVFLGDVESMVSSLNPTFRVGDKVTEKGSKKVMEIVAAYFTSGTWVYKVKGNAKQGFPASELKKV